MISVIVPVFNGEATLQRCAESILCQGCDLELIIVDDGSGDGTAALCSALSADSRVRVIRQANAGVSAARNAGLQAAAGQYILFADADDALLPDALPRLLEKAQAADAVCGGILRGKEAASDAPACRLLDHDRLMDTVLTAPTDLLTVHGWLLRRGLTEGIRFDPALRLGEDGLWMLEVLSRADAACILSRSVYRYTLSDDSAVHGERSDRDSQFALLTEKASAFAAAAKLPVPAFSVYLLIHLLLHLTHGVFRPGRAVPIRSQFREAKRLLRQPVIRDAFRQARLSALPLPQALVLVTLKLHLMLPAFAAIRIRQRKNRRSAQ